MFDILDVSSQRMIKILEILLYSEKWITIRDISKKIEVSEKTVYADLNYLTKNLNTVIEIETAVPYGIMSPKLTANIFLECQSEILLKNISIKFILLLLEVPDKDISFYSDRLCVSRSTLYRYIVVINSNFEKYDLFIEKINGKCSITGKTDIALYHFFSTFLLEIHGYNIKKFIPETLNSVLKKRLEQVFRHNGEVMSELQISYYLVFYYYAISQLGQKNAITYSSDFKGKDVAITNKDKAYFSQLTEFEMFAIESNICIHRYSMFHLTHTSMIDKVNQFQDKIYNLFQLSIKYLERDKLSACLFDLCNNIEHFQVSYYFFSDRFGYFAYQVKKNNQIAYQIMTDSIEELGKSLELDLSVYENYIIYLLVVSMPNIMQTHLKKPILIVSNHSIDHSYFLLMELQRQLNLDPIYFTNVTCIQKKSLSEYCLDNFQLIITNVNLDINHAYCIQVSDFPKAKSINKIRRILG